ncbi:hypothetical protein [Dehalogenimonas formicexedens]|uniref:hypothetical protein n=1 Tax=Dehalogenimonas formicexedens TaxID=1839801 RepID=UPI001313E343|nr:hypothetical protein [Dehalogenimonas formicexedens]
MSEGSSDHVVVVRSLAVDVAGDAVVGTWAKTQKVLKCSTWAVTLLFTESTELRSLTQLEPS